MIMVVLYKYIMFGVVVVVAAVAVTWLQLRLAHTALEVTGPHSSLGLTPFRWSPEAGRGWPRGHCTSARRRLEHKNALAAASQNHSELRVRANTAHSSPTFPAT